jgi:hypothetical protein
LLVQALSEAGIHSARRELSSVREQCVQQVGAQNRGMVPCWIMSLFSMAAVRAAERRRAQQAATCLSCSWGSARGGR